MCAASPARNSRSCCIGSTTNERIGVTPLSKISPRLTDMPKRVSSSSQIALVLPRLLVGLALQVQARDLGRAQRRQREPALVVGVDQLLGVGAACARMPIQPNGYSRS